VSFDTITLCIASQQVFIVVYFIINSVQKLLDTLVELSNKLSVTKCNHSTTQNKW